MGHLLPFAVILLAVAGGPLLAAQYYVATSGDDGNPGTSPERPFSSIGKAAAAVGPGDTVNIMPGTYAESVRVRCSGTAEAPIVFARYGAGDVVLTAPPDALQRRSGAYPFDVRGQQYLVIEGITFRDCAGMVLLQNAHHNVIRRCTLDGSRQYFNIWIDNGSHNTISGCSFRRARPWEAQETGPRQRSWAPPRLADYIDIWRDSHHNLIESCEFGEIGHCAIMIHGREPRYTATHNIVRNCRFTDSRWKCLGIHRTEHTLVENCTFTGAAADFVQFEAPKVIIRRNLFLHFRDSTQGQPAVDFRGVFRMQSTRDEYQCDNVASHNRIYHNLFYGNERTLTSSSGARLPAVDNIFKNNIFFKNRSTVAFSYQDYTQDHKFHFFSNVLFGQAPGEKLIALHTDRYTVTEAEDLLPDLYRGNVQADPLFVDEQNGDFRLRAGSPCIDRAEALTHAVGAGSGRELVVEDPLYFCDGYGLIAGDEIVVGANEPAQVTAIDYAARRLTLDRDVSWKDGDRVSLPYAGTGPDIGPYEHGDDGTE